jgi:uncharacterized protein YggE
MEEANIKKFELSDRVFILSGLLVLAVIVLIVGSLVYQFQALPQNIQQDLSVSGVGKIYAKPDIAVVSLGVKTQEIKSQDAVNKNNEKMALITKAIKDLGVADKDIQTTNYNLSPVYDWTEAGQVFKGYSLDQTVSVKIRNFDKINDILDKATTAGANTVGQLQFTVDDREKVLSEARTKAIEEAKIKAQNLAKESGLKLVKLVNVYESNNYYPSPMYGMGASDMAKEVSSVAPSIQTGELEITANMTLIYKVK